MDWTKALGENARVEDGKVVVAEALGLLTLVYDDDQTPVPVDVDLPVRRIGARSWFVGTRVAVLRGGKSTLNCVKRAAGRRELRGGQAATTDGRRAVVSRAEEHVPGFEEVDGWDDE